MIFPFVSFFKLFLKSVGKAGAMKITQPFQLIIEKLCCDWLDFRHTSFPADWRTRVHTLLNKEELFGFNKGQKI